jgi:hypothetical protein
MQQLTGMAFAIEQADAGKTVLYVVSSAKQARRMLGWDSRARRFSQGEDTTRIFVAELKERPKYLDYGAVVLDIVASPSMRRDWWTRFIEEQVPRADVYAAYSINVPAMLAIEGVPFGVLRRAAIRTAGEVNRTPAHAVGSDDQKMHAIRGRAAHTWDDQEFWPGLQTHDAQAEVDALKPSLTAIRRGADAVWVAEARESKRIAELTRWAARPLTDDEVLQELKHYGLTMLRGTYDPAWIVKQQWSELHEPEEEMLRGLGMDMYVEDRKNPASTLLHRHTLLGPRLSAQVQAGQRVSVSGADTTNAGLAALVSYATHGERVRHLLDPNNGSISKRMKPTGPASTRPDDIRFIGKLLKEVGYRCAGKQRIRQGKGRRTVADFDPIVPKPVPAAEVQPAQPTVGGGGGIDDPILEAPNIGRSSPPPLPADEKPGLTLTADPTSGLVAGFGLDLAAWLNLGVPLGQPDGFDRQTVYATVIKNVRDSVLYIPTRHRPATDKCGRCYSRWAGAGTMVQAISKTHRTVLFALPGRTLVNFDFSNAHVRIAAQLSASHDKTKEFSALAAAPDVYAFISEKLGVERAHAKLLVLIILNGGSNITQHCPPDWTAEQVSNLVAAFRRVAQPWELTRRDLNKADPIATKTGATNDKQRGSYELQRVERRLLDAVLKELRTGLPDLRLLVPMYDGALFDIGSTDEAALKTMASVIAATVATVTARLGFPRILAEVGYGQTWAQAEKH